MGRKRQMEASDAEKEQMRKKQHREKVEALLEELDVEVSARCDKMRNNLNLLAKSMEGTLKTQLLALPKDVQACPLIDFLSNYDGEVRKFNASKIPQSLMEAPLTAIRSEKSRSVTSGASRTATKSRKSTARTASVSATVSKPLRRGRALTDDSTSTMDTSTSSSSSRHDDSMDSSCLDSSVASDAGGELGRTRRMTRSRQTLLATQSQAPLASAMATPKTAGKRRTTKLSFAPMVTEHEFDSSSANESDSDDDNASAPWGATPAKTPKFSSRLPGMRPSTSARAPSIMVVGDTGKPVIKLAKGRALGVGIHGDMSGVDKAAAVEQLSDLQQQINALLKQFGK